jgi:hypothetical protein
MKKIIFLALICFTSVIAAEEQYLASFKININDELFGTPSLQVEANKQANIAVSDSYKLSFTLKPSKENTVYLPIKLSIEGKEYNPSMEVVLGKETSFIINELKMSIIITKART